MTLIIVNDSGTHRNLMPPKMALAREHNILLVEFRTRKADGACSINCRGRLIDIPA